MKANALTLLVSCLLLVSCTTYDRTWVKADASREQRKHQEAACEADALRALPPNNVRASATSTRSTCSSSDSTCKKKNEQTDTEYSYTDKNRLPRETLIKDCMFKNGWSRTKVERPLIKW